LQPAAADGGPPAVIASAAAAGTCGFGSGSVKIVLESETTLRVSGAETVSIEAEGEDVSFSPFHMVAAGLATCTFSVLYTWAMHAHLDAVDLEVAVAWQFGGGDGTGEPARVERYEVRLIWPALPEQRHAAARKAAAQCTVHNTLEQGTSVDVAVAG
jgi:uncharacterized OsmC-like protein